VTYALQAEAGGKSFQPVLDSWHKTIGQEDRDLFNLLQEIRDVEVHEKDGSIEILPSSKGRPELVQMPSDPITRASYATLLAMEILPPTREVPSYELVVQLPPGGRDKRRKIEQLFQRVRARRPLEIASDCARYAELLDSLVAAFKGAFPTPAQPSAKTSRGAVTGAPPSAPPPLEPSRSPTCSVYSPATGMPSAGLWRLASDGKMARTSYL